MQQGKWLITSLGLLSLLAAGWVGAAAKPIAGPLGTVESPGVIKINGQAAQGKGQLWGGELLQVAAETGARVQLPGLGQLNLSGDTAVRVAMAPPSSAGHKILLISLTCGTLRIKLDPEAAAYLDAPGAFFTAAPGASLRFSLRREAPEGRAVVEPFSGAVVEMGNWAIALPPPVEMGAERLRRQQQQAAQRKYLIRWTEAQLDVRARSTRQVQVQVTDENDRPVPDAVILFGVRGAAGSFSSPSAVTDAQGFAKVNFTAGNQTSTGSLTATVQGTNFVASMPVYVAKVVPGFWSVQNALPTLGVAGVATTLGIIEATTQEEPLQVRATGRPVVRP